MIIHDLHERPLHILGIDFETFFDRDFTLQKLTTATYVRDPRFKVHGASIIHEDTNGQLQKYWITAHELPSYFSQIDWENTAMLAHNCAFDAFILTQHFGFSPAYYLDTQSMSQGEFGPGVGHSLNMLSERLGLGQKIADTLDSTKGVRELSPEHEARLAEYALQDAQLMWDAFKILYKDRGYPEKELHIIDLTIRAFAEPKLEVDFAVCRAEMDAEAQKKSQLVAKAGVPISQLASNKQFAELLRSRGIEPPLKISKTTGRETYAFATGDQAFLDLASIPEITDIVQARKAVKSTINESRAFRLMQNGQPTLPIPLRYCGAITHRWSGHDSYNVQNLSSGRKEGQSDALRRAIRAPKGWKFCKIDSSQVECVCGTSSILTKRGVVNILDVRSDDLLWDGIEWVNHGGVVFKGYREVLEYEGVIATPDHIVFCADGRTRSLAEAQLEQAPLLIGERNGQAVRTLDYPRHADTTYAGVPQQVIRSMQSLRSRESYSYGGRSPGAFDKLLRRALSKSQQFLRNIAQKSRTATSSTLQRTPRANQPQITKPLVQILSQGRYTKPLQVLRGICTICLGIGSSGRLHGRRSRPYRQQWSLRTGKLAFSFSGGECAELSQYSRDILEGSTHEFLQIQARSESSSACHDSKWMDQKGSDAGADDSTRPRKVPVYDIVNAGPRFRFTCNGAIVSNCRVNAWLSNEESLLSKFRNGDDPYVELASLVYGYPVNKKEHPLQRQVGKTGELSLQFGVGSKRFTESVQIGTNGPAQPDFTMDQGVKAVQTYRAIRPNVVQSWARLDEIMRAMPSMSDSDYVYLGPGDLCRIEKDRVMMPNGLYMNYYGFQGVDDGSGRISFIYYAGKESKHLYGAKLYQNIVQSVARSIVAEQMLMIAKEIPDIVLLVHDECDFIVPEPLVEEAIDYALKCFRTPPEWCADIPLDAEAKYGDSYAFGAD